MSWGKILGEDIIVKDIIPQIQIIPITWEGETQLNE